MDPRFHIAGIKLFAGLSDSAKSELVRTSEFRTYREGEIVLQRGEPGKSFYAISSGAVSVHLSSDARDGSIILGSGEIFGEMALLSKSVVSATVIAERRSDIYVIAGETFDTLFANEPTFRAGIANNLAERLRRRTSAKKNLPSCTLIGLPTNSGSLLRVLLRGVDHYTRAIAIPRSMEISDTEGESLGRDIELWRSSALADEVCLAAVPIARVGALRTYMRPGDALLASAREGARCAHRSYANISLSLDAAGGKRSSKGIPVGQHRLRRKGRRKVA